jgi:hypothetical protein
MAKRISTHPTHARCQASINHVHNYENRLSSTTLYQCEQKEPKLAIASTCTQRTYYKEHSHILVEVQVKLNMLHDGMQCRHVTKIIIIKKMQIKQNEVPHLKGNTCNTSGVTRTKTWHDIICIGISLFMIHLVCIH